MPDFPGTQIGIPHGYVGYCTVRRVVLIREYAQYSSTAVRVVVSNGLVVLVLALECTKKKKVGITPSLIPVFVKVSTALDC